MQSFISQLINGLSTGGIYALIVLGMNLLAIILRDHLQRRHHA